MTAIFIAQLLGLSLTSYLEIVLLKMTATELLWSTLISNLAMVCSLLATLKIERTKNFLLIFKKIQPFLKAWAFFLLLNAIIFYLCIPQMRILKNFTLLFLPLLLNTGLGIVVFGWMQDYFIQRRHQQKSMEIEDFSIQKGLINDRIPIS